MWRSGLWREIAGDGQSKPGEVSGKAAAESRQGMAIDDRSGVEIASSEPFRQRFHWVWLWEDEEDQRTKMSSKSLPSLR